MKSLIQLTIALRCCLVALCLSTAFSAACDGDGDTDGDADGNADGDIDSDTDGATSSWPAGMYITPEEVHERFVAEEPDMLLLNVVDESFYNLGHIEGSLVIPWDQLPDRLDEVDAERYIVIYCRLGVRSESAFTTLDGAGYEHLWILEGGISAWIELGYPTVSEP